MSVVDSMGRSLPCALAARLVAPDPRLPRRLRAPVDGAWAPSGSASSRWVSGVESRGAASSASTSVAGLRGCLPPEVGDAVRARLSPGARVPLWPEIRSASSSPLARPLPFEDAPVAPVAPVRAPPPPPPRPRPPRRRRRFGAPVGDADVPAADAADVAVSSDAGPDVVVARARGVESPLGLSGLGVVSDAGVVRGVDERAGRGRGVGAAASSPAAPTGSRSADGGPSWVLVSMPPVPVPEPPPEPLLLRPRPPRLRRRRGAPVPVEVPAPSDDGAAVGSLASEDAVVRGAPSERCRSALVVAASSAATGLSWFIR
jgi:hypothetical protein